MGLVRSKITLGNPKRADLASIEVEALVETGAVHLCIPSHVAIQLDLEEREKREVTVADGSKHVVPYVGPVLASLEDMDLVVRPLTRELAPNPQSPNMPTAVAMGQRLSDRSQGAARRLKF